jgi:hypothetical protein
MLRFGRMLGAMWVMNPVACRFINDKLDLP